MREVKSKRIGFIGLGTMGKRMATNILKANFPLIVYDVREEPLAEMERLGARVAKSAKEVGKESDTVFIMVLNYPQVKEAVLPPKGALAGMQSGATLIITSTISPKEVCEVERVANKSRVAVIDSPVSGGPKGAEESSLALMIGADDEILKENKDILKLMGKIFHVGAAGQGQAVKMINQLLINANIVAVAEAIMMAKKLNLNFQVLMDVITNSAGDSFAFRHFAPLMKAGIYEGKSGAIDTHTKDSRIIMEVGTELEVPLWISSIPYHLFRIAASRGLNRQDATAIVKVYEEYAGVRIPDC